MLKQFLYEFTVFGFKQAYACIFGGFLLALMIISHYWYPLDWLHRYDFIFIAAILFQIILIATGLETLKEAKVILLFHIVATVMELFKTSDAIGSWYYPEDYVFGIKTVPLFTGFMYSAVGSYIARVWRIFEFRFSDYPKKSYTVILVVLIYVNFFTHHYILDMRWVLLLTTAVLFRKTKIYFRILERYRNMYLLFGWFLVALFIWIAENIATYTNIWIYPNQEKVWNMVPMAKLSSWYLLMLLSFVMVSVLNGVRLASFTLREGDD